MVVRVRDWTAASVVYGGVGGSVLSGADLDRPVTVLTFTPTGAAMAAADHDYTAGEDAATATVWRNHKAARVYAAGRP